MFQTAANVGNRKRFPADRHIEAGPGLPAGSETAIPEAVRSLVEILPEGPTVSSALDRLGKTDLDAYRLLAALQDRRIIQFRSTG